MRFHRTFPALVIRRLWKRLGRGSDAATRTTLASIIYNPASSSYEVVSMAKTRSTAGSSTRGEEVDEREYISWGVLFRALFARVLFAMHGLLTIWRASFAYRDYSIWIFSLFIIAIFIEAGITLLKQGCEGPKWFTPCILLFLCGVVPPLWMLELQITEHRINTAKLNAEANKTSDTMTAAKEQLVMQLADGVKVRLWIPIRPEYWAPLLEQTLLVVLILGRWILPKGDLTRQQLSHILLVYLAIAADIVELFEVFKEPAVRYNPTITYAILSAWSVSLLQYPVTMAGGGGAKFGGKKPTRMQAMRRDAEAPNEPSTTAIPFHVGSFIMGGSNEEQYATSPTKDVFSKWGLWRELLQNPGSWGIVMSIILQDGPFLIIRLYLLANHRLLSYSMIFFTCKNTLICLLQLYRLMVMCTENYRKLKRNRLANLINISLRNGDAAMREKQEEFGAVEVEDPSQQGDEKHGIFREGGRLKSKARGTPRSKTILLQHYKPGEGIKHSFTMPAICEEDDAEDFALRII